MDGSDDRIMSNEHQFALKMHSSPDLENIGHIWEVVEV